MSTTIRPARVSDSPALSTICLLTANAGTSAVHLHKYPEFPGLVYAEPYIKMPSTFGYVVEAADGQVVGYCLATTDSRKFEQEEEELWWPPLRIKYPIELQNSEELLPQDKYFIGLFHNMHRLDDASIAFSPAHLHIDILPQYQRKGLGRQLIDACVKYLQQQSISGLWIGMDTRNETAKPFYGKLGFRKIEGGPEGVLGLAFADWKGA